jgi:hypothetical protein
MNDDDTEATKYHAAGDAYCDCERGEDHEGDPEADEAWDLLGPMGLARLAVKRQQAQSYRLRARLARIAEICVQAELRHTTWRMAIADIAELATGDGDER